jgi:hypothetical protein
MKRPIIKYKRGEPTMIIKKDGTYVDNNEEWNEVIKKLSKKRLYKR